jgi:hypothetical protein
MELQEYDRLNGGQFQDLIADLFNAHENTNTYIVSGRSGQYQGGSDIFSVEKKTIIQCKFRSSGRSVAKARADLKRSIECSAASVSDWAEFPFSHLIIASTYSHDIALQEFAIELQNKEQYPFVITYVGWEEIRRRILQHRSIFERYFADASSRRVELVSVMTDTENCSWIPYGTTPNAFKDIESKKSPYPIFDFSFVNHLNKTVVLSAIKLRMEYLYSGLSGPPSSYILKPIAKYTLYYDSALGENVLLVDPPFAVPAGEAFRFQVEVCIPFHGELLAPSGRSVCYFAFQFNSDIQVTAPDIFLNTEDNSEGLPQFILMS